jgi:hypothetical protein
MNTLSGYRAFTTLLPILVPACGGCSDGQPNVTVSFFTSPLTTVAGNPVTVEWSRFLRYPHL